MDADNDKETHRPHSSFEAFAFLNEAALVLAQCPTEGPEIYQRVVDLVSERFPHALMVICSFDPRVELLHPEAMRVPAGAQVAVDALLEANPGAEDFFCLDGVWRVLLDARLRHLEGGIYQALFGHLPLEACRAFEAHTGLVACYGMGLTDGPRLLGSVVLGFRTPLDPASLALIEALLLHASTALQRKQAEDELRVVVAELDLTVQRRTRDLAAALAEVRQGRRSLQALLDASGESAVLLGLDGQVQACNELAAARLGLAREALVGRDPASLMAPDQAEGRRLRTRQILETGEPVRFVAHEGGRVLDTTLAPVLGHDESIQGFACFARDITEQRQAEAALRRAGAFQVALFQSMSEGILVADPGGVISDCNRAVLASFDQTREQMIGRNLSELCAQRSGWARWRGEHLPRLLQSGAAENLELRLRRLDGSVFTGQIGASLARLPDEPSPTIIWVVRDVTAELLRVEQLEYQATHDDLTGLPNRLLLRDRLERFRELGRRYSTSFALLMMDLDGFKEVNDRHGHEAGDQLLAALGTRLRASLRSADTVSRLGGDEFAVLLSGPWNGGGAVQVAEKLLHFLERPFTVGGAPQHISASIGVAIFPEHDGPRQNLLTHADQAMYAAKRAGGHRVVLFSDELADRS
ncbi:MAG: diguanylate cyclase [Pseudomonadota bacterium]